MPSRPLLRHPALLAVLCLAAVLAVAGCDTDEPDRSVMSGEAGTLVSSARIDQHTPDELYQDLGVLAEDLLPDDFPVDDPADVVELLAGQINQHAYGVELHRLLYRTTNPDGDVVLASGVVSLAQRADTLGARPLALYDHGTIVERRQVASVIGYDDRETLAVSLFFASDGYVTAVPDYLGLGAATLPSFTETPTEPFHPYILAAPYATASVDFLRAVRRFCEQQGIALDGDLFVTGYSEGGYASMSTHRAIQQEYAGEFSVTASAPMAGPYDLSGTTRRSLLQPASTSSPYYLPFVLNSYNRVYDLYDDLSEVFRAPYAGVDTLFNGQYSSSEINNFLPEVPRDILKESYIEDFQNDYDHPFRAALRANDLWDWAPQAPMQMGHSTTDELVDFQNSEVALEEFRARGAAGNVSLVTVEESTLNSIVDVAGAMHEEAFVPLAFETKLFFNDVRGTGPDQALSREALDRQARRLRAGRSLRR